MQELMQFEGNNVEIVQDENGNPLFEVYSTGMALGYITFAKGKAYPQKVRIDKIVENAEITLVVHGVQRCLTESQLYDFMLEARTDKCRKFRKWVTNEVLPSINKTGSYSTSQTPQLPYTYIEKTYHARPIITTKDISHIFGINQVTLYNFIKTKLIPDIDYSLLEGETLTDYIRENPTLTRSRKSIFVIYYKGLLDILSHYRLDKSKIPNFIAKQKGYVVQSDVKQLMDYVRRELKGIECLTYLIESNDSVYNLENYRKILVQKLSEIHWWRIDVNNIKLGVHNITGTEFSDIHNAVYGMKY